MSVYASLCNPDKAGDWGNALATEGGLRALFTKEIRAKISEAVSRPERPRVGGRDPAQRIGLFRDLYGKFVAGPDRVLIGRGALAIAAREDPRDERIQVISVSPLEAEARAVASLGKERGFEVQWTVNDPKVPTDPRLRRLTLYLVAEGRREPIMDVFNAAEYELVPYLTAGAASVSGGARPPGGPVASAGGAGGPRTSPPGGRGPLAPGGRGQGRDTPRRHEVPPRRHVDDPGPPADGRGERSLCESHPP